jgi:ribonuclease J
VNPLQREILKITPLGGLSEIGSNTTLIQSIDKNFIIDCGILFPRDDLFGINF